MLRNRGSILIYAIILVNLVVFLAFMIFSRSEILLKNANFQEYNAKLLKNINEKIQLVVKYDAYLNSNGSGFIDTRACPVVTLTPGGNNTTLPTYSSGAFNCTSASLSLDLTPDGQYFRTIIFSGSTKNITIGLSSSGTFADGTQYAFSLPGMSGIDIDFNSDNYSPNSTGSTTYPGGSQDDDALAREIGYGYVRRNGGWYNIFWNNLPMENFIAANPNNSDGFHAPIASMTGAMMYLDTDQPISVRVVTFSSGAYSQSSEMKRLTDVSYTITTSGYGYLQSNGSLVGTLGSSYGASPLTFDLKNNNYGIFLSYTGAVSGVSDFASYKLRFTSPSGSGIYIVPIDDSGTDFYTFLGGDIIIDSENNFVSRQLKLLKAK